MILVASYCRVSTDKDDQANSFDAKWKRVQRNSNTQGREQGERSFGAPPDLTYPVPGSYSTRSSDPAFPAGAARLHRNNQPEAPK